MTTKNHKIIIVKKEKNNLILQTLLKYFHSKSLTGLVIPTYNEMFMKFYNQIKRLINFDYYKILFLKI